jgi:hypothetical protein
MSKQTVVESFTDQNTCFLLGAGCSICADKPNIDLLTKKVRENSSTPVQELLDDLEGRGNREANVEDLINYLLRMRQLVDSRKTPFDKDDWRAESIETELANIQKAVVHAVGIDWTPCSYHERFLARLASSGSEKPIDIFTLNYDTVLEASLESQALRYTDGFVGSENSYFEPAIFEHVPPKSAFFRLCKLHGSVNWVRDEDERVRRKPGALLGDTPRAVVYPAEQKYLQTQYGIYETLMTRFRDRLRSPDKNNKLVILGYSFSDEHVNVAIEDGIRSPGSNLTVHAFAGPEDDIDVQKIRLDAMVNRCDHRLNIVVADKYRLGPAIDDIAWKEIADLNLWKFESVVDFLVEKEDE